MTKKLVLSTIVALAALCPAAGIAANDPLAAVKSDVAKLTADADSARATVASDATNGDVAKLKRDARSAFVTLKADQKQLLLDAKTARKAAGKAELRSLLKAARQELNQFRTDVRTAFAQARGTSKQTKASKSKSGKGSDDESGQ